MLKIEYSRYRFQEFLIIDKIIDNRVEERIYMWGGGGGGVDMCLCMFLVL